MSTLVVFLALCLPLSDSAKITITTLPDRPLLERGSYSQLLNFDFILTNSSTDTIVLKEMEVSIFDKLGKLVNRKSINTNGDFAAIKTLNLRRLLPQDSKVIYNPFYEMVPDFEIGRLIFVFHFYRQGNASIFEYDPFLSEFQIKKDVHPLPSRAIGLTYPITGRSIVYDGHDYYSHHRRVDVLHPGSIQYGITTNPGRYSLDICPVDSQGNMYVGDPTINANWFGFGQAVRAVSKGKVLKAVDARQDDKSVPLEAMAIDPIESFGNYILVDHLDGTFGVYGHLKYGSLKVQVGQMVKPGEVLAAIGASGSSLMPHLHFEMINSPQYKLAEGLPIYFKGIKVEGVSNHHSQLICPDSGDFVWVDK